MTGLAVAYAGLLVSVATLLWRVWRLEVRANNIEGNALWLRDGIVDRAHQSSLLALSERVAGDLHRSNALARALGYEWKRTDAKEGWEKKAATPTLYDLWTHEAALLNYERDRRKADRRKPVIAKAADDPFPSPLDRGVTPKKKPRRAH